WRNRIEPGHRSPQGSLGQTWPRSGTATGSGSGSVWDRRLRTRARRTRCGRAHSATFRHLTWQTPTNSVCAGRVCRPSGASNGRRAPGGFAARGRRRPQLLVAGETTALRLAWTSRPNDSIRRLNPMFRTARRIAPVLSSLLLGTAVAAAGALAVGTIGG